MVLPRGKKTWQKPAETSKPVNDNWNSETYSEYGQTLDLMECDILSHLYLWVYSAQMTVALKYVYFKVFT